MASTSVQGFLVEKSHHKSDVVYGPWVPFQFASSTLSAAQALTTVIGYVPVGIRCSILKVSCFWTAITGAVTFNVVYGVGTALTVAAANNPPIDVYSPTLATLNSPLFASAQTLSTAVASGAAEQDFYPDAQGAVYDDGGVFTLRASTVASTGALSNFSVIMYGVLLDANPSNAALNTPFGTSPPTPNY